MQTQIPTLSFQSKNSNNSHWSFTVLLYNCKIVLTKLCLKTFQYCYNTTSIQIQIFFFLEESVTQIKVERYIKFWTLIYISIIENCLDNKTWSKHFLLKNAISNKKSLHYKQNLKEDVLYSYSITCMYMKCMN